jgi:TM2 domain-containing membrane protein YozV
MSFVPAEMKALLAFLLIIFIGPFILAVVSMLLLFFCGKDFKGDGAVKSKLVAYLLWFFLGFVSAHKFYLEKDGIGILYFLTWQIVFLGWWVDLFTLGKQVDKYNARLNDGAQVSSQS